MQSKVKDLNEISSLIEQERRKGNKIVQCHGVFDLLHPGHIRHFKEAKKQGDKLVVSLTPDKFVNKGPGRPAFNEALRLETLSSVNCIDYVVLNDAEDAIPIINKIKPDIYVKGNEYADINSDITGKISDETLAVEKNKGKVFHTNDIVFSSSSLINSYIDPLPPSTKKHIDKIKQEFSFGEIKKIIDSFKELKVLVIGDAILDEYQYTQPLGQSGKGTHMTVSCLDNELYLGGSLIVAAHLAEFADNVTLISSIGKECPHNKFIKKKLHPNIKTQFYYNDKHPTLIKKRYVIKDGNRISKLFETYSSNEPLLKNESNQEVIRYLEKEASKYDLVLVADFGNGFTNPLLINTISELPNFLAVNTQVNSGNRGYNIATNYKRADFISLNEPELRLATNDKYAPIEALTSTIAKKLSCPKITITRGVNGAFCYSSHSPSSHTPALISNAIDRVGAGDCFFAIAALAACKKLPVDLCGFLGSIASAINVQIICNKEPLSKIAYLKFLNRLMK